MSRVAATLTPRRVRRLGAASAVTVLVLAACGATDSTSEQVPAETGAPAPVRSDPFRVEQVESSPVDVTASGLAALRGGLPDGAPEPLVPLAEIRSGGPPPDGIPPIDDPRFVPPAAVNFLGDNEPVLAIEIGDDARAYPVQILMWHEIVNDTIGGLPVAVTYCPLCNSALAYDRRVEDLVLDFGTSGSLWNSALVMYDRQTETLWSHFTGAGIVGELTGVELETFPVATVPWGIWRDANPDGLVLSQETGFIREYGRNPYPGYDNVNNQPFLFEGEVDGTFTAMTRIVGIELEEHALGVPLFRLQEERVIAAELGGEELVVFWEPGTNSALGNINIASGDDIGATGVFRTEVEGTNLQFDTRDGRFIDEQTGSTWNLLGHAVDGPLEGARLKRIPHVDTFWFAWAAFQPDTALIG